MKSAEEIRQGKRAREEKQKITESRSYVEMICRIYGDRYDDREEDSRIKGLNWEPGVRAAHKSISAFQKELDEIHGIHLSRTKIQKILITGGCWTTERSREIQELYEEYRSRMQSQEAIQEIAGELAISAVSVIINLPYEKVVYDLENKSENARRIEKCRKIKSAKEEKG